MVLAVGLYHMLGMPAHLKSAIIKPELPSLAAAIVNLVLVAPPIGGIVIKGLVTHGRSVEKVAI